MSSRDITDELVRPVAAELRARCSLDEAAFKELIRSAVAGNSAAQARRAARKR